MTDVDLAGASMRLRNWATLDTTDPYAIEIFRADVLAVVAQVADYENRITWHTTCQQCATTLDRAITDYERTERAVARVAELEAKLASLTEPTEYGSPGVQWSVDHHGTVDGRPSGDVVPMGEKAARRTAASWRAAGILPDPVLLRREHTAWRRWPLDEAEADRMSADAARFSAAEPSRHDSPRCAPAGGGCACQGGRT